MKKILSLALSLFMLATLFGCSNSSNGNKYDIETGEKPKNNVWNIDGTIFPLKNKETFTILTEGYRGSELDAITNNTDWKQLQEATNIEINFIDIGDYGTPESREAMQLRLMSEEYGDAIWSFYIDTLSTADIDELASSGIAIPINKYMEDSYIMPNFNREVYPNELIMKNMKSADGNIYSFMGISEIKANDAGEALMQVNVDWMEAWQKATGINHSPETLEEFENMLKFFAESDLNGNGLQDEIPYFITQGMYAGCMSLEHAMGMFGIGTKDSALDMDIMINDDGKCYFAYTTEEYKAGLKQFADWYKKGYVYKELFTANNETVTSIVADAKNKFGIANICEPMEGFEAILPPSIDGFTAKYHMHPSARTVTRQPNAIITNKCEHPEILAAFFDLWYNFDNYNTFVYGSVNIGEGKAVQISDGKYAYNCAENVFNSEADYALNHYLGGMEVQTLKYFEENVDLNAYYSARITVYDGSKMYREAGVWNKTENLWPRCSLLEEDATDFAFLLTDVSAVLKEYRAKFITGAYDIDTQWNEFQNKIKEVGVDSMRDMIQRSYDAWNSK